MKITVVTLIFSIFAYAATDSYFRGIPSMTQQMCQSNNPGQECEQDPLSRGYFPKCKEGYAPSGSNCTRTVPDVIARMPFADLATCTAQNPQGCDSLGPMYYPKCTEGYIINSAGNCQWSKPMSTSDLMRR